MYGHAERALEYKRQAEDGTLASMARRIKRARIFSRLKSWYYCDRHFRRGV